MVYFDLIGGILYNQGYDIAEITPTIMSNVRCNGNETLIQSCLHDPWGATICRRQILMVSCYPSKYI